MTGRIASLLVALLLVFPAGAAQARAARPNIVLIMADDMGWADLPAYGNAVTEAPAIDRLATEGMRFTRFYAQPVCSPSRVELMSGRYPVRSGVTDFISGHWRPYEQVVTPRTAVQFVPQLPSLGTAMQQQGYRTAYFGKWHLGDGVNPADLGWETARIDYGFDHMAPSGLPSVDDMAAQAEAVISSADERPFLLFLSPTQPHIPLRAHRADIAHFQARLDARGQVLPVAEYSAMVLDFDRLVARVLDAIEAQGIGGDTLVIVFSDNGGLEHTDLGLDDPVTSNAPLRGEKGTLYEGGLRVPFVVRWPGRVAPGSQTDTPAGLLDLLPTLLDIAEAPSVGRDGISLLQVLDGGSASVARALFYHYPHYHHGRPGSAIIAGNWKLIENFDDGSLELYDLASDISESRNLARQEPDRAASMQRQLAAWRMETGARMTSPNPLYDPQRAAEWWRLEDVTQVTPDGLRDFLGPRPFADQ